MIDSTYAEGYRRGHNGADLKSVVAQAPRVRILLPPPQRDAPLIQLAEIEVLKTSRSGFESQRVHHNNETAWPNGKAEDCKSLILGSTPSVVSISECSSVCVERLIWVQEAAGSNPATRTSMWM